MTPMMKTFADLRAKLPENSILFFRLGDFYETFHEDAEAAAPILQTPLTKRNGNRMTGFPYWRKAAATETLVKLGKTVVFAEQEPRA